MAKCLLTFFLEIRSNFANKVIEAYTSNILENVIPELCTQCIL